MPRQEPVASKNGSRYHGRFYLASSAGDLIPWTCCTISGTNESKAEAVLISNGINMENYVSQQLTEEDLTEDALVITMEEIHRERILEQFENAIPENIQVLTKYVGDELEILDPYGGFASLWTLL